MTDLPERTCGREHGFYAHTWQGWDPAVGVAFYTCPGFPHPDTERAERQARRIVELEHATERAERAEKLLREASSPAKRKK